MDSSEGRFTEPAKLADRVLAPGEGFAEPGGRDLQILVTNRLSPASQALRYLAKLTPGSGLRRRQGIGYWGTLSASFAGSVDVFLKRISHQPTKTLSEKQEVTNLLHRVSSRR
jgi:hypothetical protein